ncbi:hypothetical protein [Chroogloeocystis siderophila]|nr:hypothetical protein [Chroogloeocystis siderophila]
MANQLWRLALATSGILMLATTAQAEVAAEEMEGIRRKDSLTPLSDFKQPATAIAEWMAQIEQSAIQVTGVQVNVTETGLNLTLETNEPLATPSTSVVGNTLIADIPNTKSLSDVVE